MPNNTFGDVLREGTARLESRGVPDASFDARCLLSQAMGCPLSVLRLRMTETADEQTKTAFSAMLSRRAEGEPLQYILGEWDFFGFTFRVREGVLIPRPETEFLVRQAIRLLPQGGVLYDVCAGTGCIGLAAALHRPDAQVYLFEKYPAALIVAQENARLLRAENAHVIPCDMLCGVPADLPAPDMIVSNPPYIPTSELPALQREVQREPVQALDGGEDGLRFFRALRALWFPLLPAGGALCMECGEGQPPEAAAMFPGSVSVDADYVGTERFVTVTVSGD